MYNWGMNEYDPNYIPQKTYVLIGQKAIVLNKKNQILLLQRSEKSGNGGKWSLPGGALEFQEDPFDSIKREIEEETQLKVSKLKPFSVRSYLTQANDFVVVMGYSCFAYGETVVLNWEHDDYKWLEKHKAFQLDLSEDGIFFLKAFI